MIIKTEIATAHLRAAVQSMKRYDTTLDRADAMKAVQHGVRAAIMFSNDQVDPEVLFNLFELVRQYIAILTPIELMQIFPVDKKYDGARWGCKDYFYTMDMLREHGLNTPIGDRIDDILWDYTNTQMRIFTVRLTTVTSKIYRELTGEGRKRQTAAIPDQGSKALISSFSAPLGAI